MARPPKGKPLTYRGLRLDDDVWAECQKLRAAYGTINEILVAALAALRMQSRGNGPKPHVPDRPGTHQRLVKPPLRRGPREKGDKQR